MRSLDGGGDEHKDTGVIRSAIGHVRQEKTPRNDEATILFCHTLQQWPRTENPFQGHLTLL